MDYLLKSSVILALFWLCYSMFLQRETFFVGNRWFLLLGLIVSILIPLIVIPIYVEYTPSVIENMPMSSAYFPEATMVAAPPIENPFTLVQFVTIVYSIGVIFFIGKLFMEFLSLTLMLKKHGSYNDRVFHYIETDLDIAPFSFFKWIVYNPTQFQEVELKLILNHEKVHAQQLHSLDVIIAQLACAVFWFNPIMWLYKKALQQNLEFIADREAQTDASTKKVYQNLLLKTTISSHQMAMTNNFYNSIIKKRIVMLHTSKSNKMNAYKYALILPLLVLFVFNFNTEIVAQDSQPEKTKIGQNVLKYVITKDTKDSQLESIKEKMLEQKVTIVFKDLKRNDTKEITGIRITYDSTKGSGEFFVNSDEAIKDIAITLNVDENILSVGQAMKNLSQSFEIITDDEGDKKVRTSGSGENVFVYSTDDDDNDDNVIVRGKDGENHEVKKEKNVYVIKSGATKDSDNDDASVFVKKNKKDTIWVKKDVKNIIWTDDDGNVIPINTSENSKNSYSFITKGDKEPLVIVNGKKTSFEELGKLNKDSFVSLNVLKGEKGIESYGAEGKDGVLILTTTNNTSFSGKDKAIVVDKKKSGPWEISPIMEVSTYEIDTTISESFSISSIDRNTPDKHFDQIKTHLKKEGVVFDYSKLKRNKEGYIVRIKIDLKTDTGKSKSATFTNDDGISEISFGLNNGGLFLNSGN